MFRPEGKLSWDDARLRMPRLWSLYLNSFCLWTEDTGFGPVQPVGKMGFSLSFQLAEEKLDQSCAHGHWICQAPGALPECLQHLTVPGQGSYSRVPAQHSDDARSHLVFYDVSREWAFPLVRVKDAGLPGEFLARSGPLATGGQVLWSFDRFAPQP